MTFVLYHDFSFHLLIYLIIYCETFLINQLTFAVIQFINVNANDFYVNVNDFCVKLKQP